MAVQAKDRGQSEGNGNEKGMDNGFGDSNIPLGSSFNTEKARCCNCRNLSTLQKMLIAIVIITTIAGCICVVFFLPKKLPSDACIGDERCQNGGTCVLVPNNNSSCVCAKGYEGQVCANVTNNCAPNNPCLNRGTCVNGIGSFSCTCVNEFAGDTCQYLNECQYEWSCTPLKHSDSCHKCRDGFVKYPGYYMRCIYANASASLILSSMTDIRMISLDGTNTPQIIQNKSDVYGTDYDFQTNTIFWFSGSDRQIYKAPINEKAEKKSIFHDSSSWIDGVAVDWVHQHLYWVDRERDQIGVSNFNGSMKKVLFNNEIPHPRSIAVDPLNGWMYWTGTLRSCTERAGLDGSRREIILDNDASFDRTPESLVVDFVDRRLYWSQIGHPSSIWSSEFDGSNRKLIFGPTSDELPSSYFKKIATFDVYIYFIDVFYNSIFKINKCNGIVLEINDIPIKLGLNDIHIFNGALQPKGKNLCLKRIDRCSHFCFPVPSPGNGSVSVYTTTVCACPDRLSLSADQHNCV